MYRFLTESTKTEAFALLQVKSDRLTSSNNTKTNQLTQCGLEKVKKIGCFARFFLLHVIKVPAPDMAQLLSTTDASFQT